MEFFISLIQNSDKGLTTIIVIGILYLLFQVVLKSQENIKLLHGERQEILSIIQEISPTLSRLQESVVQVDSQIKNQIIPNIQQIPADLKDLQQDQHYTIEQIKKLEEQVKIWKETVEKIQSLISQQQNQNIDYINKELESIISEVQEITSILNELIKKIEIIEFKIVR